MDPTPPSDDAAPGSSEGEASGGERKPLRERIIDAISRVYDPEIPVNIYDLGLIYDVEIDDATGNVTIRMTLTSPACPVAESLPLEVRRTVACLPDVNEVEIDLVFDPPWGPERMTDDVKLALGLF